jgi:hypothetical protein
LFSISDAAGAEMSCYDVQTTKWNLYLLPFGQTKELITAELLSRITAKLEMDIGVNDAGRKGSEDRLLTQAWAGVQDKRIIGEGMIIAAIMVDENVKRDDQKTQVSRQRRGGRMKTNLGLNLQYLDEEDRSRLQDLNDGDKFELRMGREADDDSLTDQELIDMFRDLRDIFQYNFANLSYFITSLYIQKHWHL